MVRSLFLVTTRNGFLPRQWPLACLPPRYAVLEELLQAMPVKRQDGQPGLLALGEFGGRVETTLPNLHTLIKAERDPHLLHGKGKRV